MSDNSEVEEYDEITAARSHQFARERFAADYTDALLDEIDEPQRWVAQHIHVMWDHHEGKLHARHAPHPDWRFWPRKPQP